MASYLTHSEQYCCCWGWGGTIVSLLFKSTSIHTLIENKCLELFITYFSLQAQINNANIITPDLPINDDYSIYFENTLDISKVVGPEPSFTNILNFMELFKVRKQFLPLHCKQTQIIIQK